MGYFFGPSKSEMEIEIITHITEVADEASEVDKVLSLLPEALGDSAGDGEHGAVVNVVDLVDDIFDDFHGAALTLPWRKIGGHGAKSEAMAQSLTLPWRKIGGHGAKLYSAMAQA